MIGAAALSSAAILPNTVSARTTHRLGLVSLHTGERASVAYRIDGKLEPEALGALDNVLRDHRTGEVLEIDRTLLDLMHRLAQALETDAPFQIISGYRSPRTNAMLAARGKGVARRSFHQWGMAVDLRLRDRSLDDIYVAARSLQGGGVGKYVRSNFVHIDTGRVRTWHRG